MGLLHDVVQALNLQQIYVIASQGKCKFVMNKFDAQQIIFLFLV